MIYYCHFNCIGRNGYNFSHFQKKIGWVVFGFGLFHGFGFAGASLLTALSDERVSGCIPIDLYSHPSTGYLIHSYRKRLLLPHSWKKLVSGQSDVWPAFRKAFLYLKVVKIKNEDAENELAENPVLNFEPLPDAFKTLAERQVPVYLIFSDGSPAYYTYRLSYKKQIASLSGNCLFKVTHFDTADHGFTFLYHQKRMMEEIKQWVVAVIG